jgi:hypothetical protein
MSIGIKSDSGGNGGTIQSTGVDILSVSNSGSIGEVGFLGSVSEAVQGSFAGTISGALSIPVSSGTVVLGDTSASITSWDFTGVPTGNSRSTTVAVVIAGHTAYTYPDACTVNGVSVSGGVRWSGGVAPSPTNNTDIITFSIIKDSTGVVRVFGFSVTNVS